MNSDDWLAPTIVQGDDNFRHVGELIAACKTDDSLTVTATWRRQSEPVVGMPVAEIAQSPIRGHDFTEPAKVIDVEAKMRVVSLCRRSGLGGEEDCWKV